MDHRKMYHAEVFETNTQTLCIEGPVSSNRLQELKMHDGLKAFRRPDDQHEALIEISELEEGRIIIASDNDTIVGYVTFHYPDELERWSDGDMKELIELGAIEVADSYRSIGLGKRMIQLAFLENQMENVIVFTTEYYWHWDLKGSGLNVWEYRKLMEKLMECVDMVWYATDDPEICSHPANCLMVRIGKEVSLDCIEQFDRIRFQRKIMY